jgi:class 3 adenylate cyclase
MRVALAVHHRVLRSAIEEHDGFLFSHTGDGVAAAFPSRVTAAGHGGQILLADSTAMVTDVYDQIDQARTELEQLG